MTMSRFIVRRILAISAVILLGGVVLAVWRAQFDVAREERGAADEVRLFEVLYAIENGPADEIDGHLADLRALNASRTLRHIRFSLIDGNGSVLVAANETEPPDFLQRMFAKFAPGDAAAAAPPWLLQRDDGRKFYASLALDPASEQQESLDNLEGMLFVLAGYALLILLAIYFTSTRALAPMRSLLDAIDRYRRNDFSARLPTLPFAETDAIGGALNHMAGALSDAQEQRRELSLKLVSSQEDERMRIARELHDQFGQSLTAMRADLSWLIRRAEDSPQTKDVLHGMSQQCETLQLGIRDLLNRLRPVDAHASGFAAALKKLIDDLVHGWNDRLGESTRFSLDYTIDEHDVGDDVALAVYRLTQEALTNAVRHAHASNVVVRIVRDDGAVDWSVEDDGVGIADIGSSLAAGNGIAGMRERAWALGSDLHVTPAHLWPTGLRLAARFPRLPFPN